MPWWLLGISMVATTFSADTPNLVTDIVRKNGVAGNWIWWAFLLTGMLTVFIYARLWRRSGVLTDIEFYELRYSGRSAAFLRGFRARLSRLFLQRRHHVDCVTRRHQDRRHHARPVTARTPSIWASLVTVMPSPPSADCVRFCYLTFCCSRYRHDRRNRRSLVFALQGAGGWRSLSALVINAPELSRTSCRSSRNLRCRRSDGAYTNESINLLLSRFSIIPLGRAVVERLVPQRRTGRRWLCGPAHAGRAQ